MIVTIIVVLFAIFYWLFSVSLLATCMYEYAKELSWLPRLLFIIEILICAPVFVPIMLGIDIGSNMVDKVCD